MIRPSWAAWSAGYRAGEKVAAWLRGPLFTLIRLVSLGLGLGIAGIRTLSRVLWSYKHSKRLKKRID